MSSKEEVVWSICSDECVNTVTPLYVQQTERNVNDV